MLLLFSSVPTVEQVLNIEEVHDLYNKITFTELTMCWVYTFCVVNHLILIKSFASIITQMQKLGH